MFTSHTIVTLLSFVVGQGFKALFRPSFKIQIYPSSLLKNNKLKHKQINIIKQ